MAFTDRLPALPLIVNDPYFSVWLPADRPTDCETAHWCGEVKPISGTVQVDGGKPVKYFGSRGGLAKAETKDVTVTPTQTVFVSEHDGVELTVTFWAPALPYDLDTLSTPITYVDLAVKSTDGQKHQAKVTLSLPDNLCYDGCTRPEMVSDQFADGDMNVSYIGRTHQNVLCHSGDHITIDWGYLFMATKEQLNGQTFVWETEAGAEEKTAYMMAAYDDIASINYFGTPCKAWYARGGRTIMDAIHEFAARHDEFKCACGRLDAEVTADAMAAGGKPYAKIAAAGWRHAFGAHKLIATPKGEMAWISKENDSNGCAGTVDVSYPSTPLFLKYCPELVSAMCRPVLEYAKMPVWKYDFAPHDVGRYPQVIGQMYAINGRPVNGAIGRPVYLYPAASASTLYSDSRQMPVEESGNMLIMLYSAIAYGADDGLARDNMESLGKWVRYLVEFGEDPGEQLCTDDFAGHLAHNVNLSAKACVGIECYAKLLERFGQTEEAKKWHVEAKRLIESWHRRTQREGGTPLTFDGQGWSQKYNLVWDKVLKLGLLPDGFYRAETQSYLPRVEKYGLPLDSRADYTKSDWICWCAAMADKKEDREKLLQPIADYLRESTSRVAFSDWYDVKTGMYQAFIARSVQGGLYMPMLVPCGE